MGRWINAGALVAALEFLQLVGIFLAVVSHYYYLVGVHKAHDAAFGRQDAYARIHSRLIFNARAYYRRFGHQKGHGLTLHVAPISAREASSFSKKGIIAVATETTCLGETSI